MRVKDLRWYILACIILLISYAAIAYCFYLPVQAKAIGTMQSLSIEAVNNDIQIAQNSIQSYYQEFVNGNHSGVETEFNKTGFKDKMNGSTIKIAPKKEMIFEETSTELMVFFYNYNALETVSPGGYLPLQEILSFTNFKMVLFSKTAGIEFNTVTSEAVGTITGMLNDASFYDNFILNLTENGYSKVYSIEGVSGILSINQFYDYYYSIFIPLDSAFFSIEWVRTEAIIFYSIGVVFLAIMIVLIIFACRKAAVLLRVDSRSVQNVHSIVIRVKKDGRIIFANTAFKKLFKLKKLPDINDFKEVYSGKSIFNFFKSKQSIQCFYDFEDQKRYFQLTPVGVLSTYYLIGSDITDEYMRIKSLEQLNGKNEYTGCDNNFTLYNVYPSVIATATTDIAFIGFNIYKYNDIISLFGVDSFKILLNELLAILKEQFPQLPIYQVRDEKFVILFPNFDIKDAISAVRRTMEILKKPILIKKNNIFVHCKVPIFNLVQEEMRTTTLDQVMLRLDLANNNIMSYEAKDIIVYTPAMEGVVTASDAMEEDLKNALENNEFKMFLQPQYNVVTNKIVGFEALIRWMNPKYVKKSPQAFIELAEQRGYILDISRFVIRETFRLAKQLEKYNVTISLNLSPIQILQVGFVNDLIGHFNEQNLSKGSIALEITETFLMENFSLVNEKLNALKKAGFKIHLDDFCTGYSSMAYLKDLPVDTIKIDYEFTRYVDTNKVNYSIVSCICTLAKELSLDVICEGVETKDQQAVVKKLGCKIIQGFLIGKAMPFEDAVKLLKNTNVQKGEK